MAGLAEQARSLPEPAASAGARALALGLLRHRLLRFLAVGLCGLATDGLVFTLCSREGAVDAVARAVSLGAATLVTWRLNRAFTFDRTGRPQLGESLRYALVAAGAQGFNYALFLALRALAPDWPALVAILVSAVCATGFSFTGQRFFTFARQS